MNNYEKNLQFAEQSKRKNEAKKLQFYSLILRPCHNCLAEIENTKGISLVNMMLTKILFNVFTRLPAK